MSELRPRATTSSIWSIAGGLALVATLALTSPGVRVARASDPSTGSVADAGETPLMSVDPALVAQAEGVRAPACSTTDQRVADDAVARQLQAMVQQQIRQLELRARAGEGSDEVVLNGRGYNYPRTAPMMVAPE